MSLHLGKIFDRRYSVRLPFLNGNYNISIFYDKSSSFLLFDIEDDFPQTKNIDRLIKISMFKNLGTSKFCEIFLKLHSYKKSTLDILNQFHEILPEHYHDISFLMNETISLSRVEVGDKILVDSLTIYGFTINVCSNEFIFILAERQNICKKLNKKIVRTAGLQISTPNSLETIDEFNRDKSKGKLALEKVIHDSTEVLVIS